MPQIDINIRKNLHLKLLSIELSYLPLIANSNPLFAVWSIPSQLFFIQSNILILWFLLAQHPLSLSLSLSHTHTREADHSSLKKVSLPQMLCKRKLGYRSAQCKNVSGSQEESAEKEINFLSIVELLFLDQILLL